MKPIRIVVAVLAALAVLVATACGSDKETVPPNAVAVVDGTVVTKAELDALLARAKASYKAQKRAFPKAGTADYQSLQSQGVAILVTRAEYANKAEELKLTVTDKEIEDRIAQLKQQSFGGSQAKLDAQLKAAGYTKETLNEDVRSQLISEKIYNEVTKTATVSDEEIANYYKEHKSEFAVPESRVVRHILVKTQAQANGIYDQVKAGASFAALAKKYSLDEGSKAAGGTLTISRGQTVPEFDATAFQLPTNSISRPVKTQFGYHVIQPTANVIPGTTTPLKDAKLRIQAQLLDTAKKDSITKWTDETKAYFAKNVVYATGYAPPEAATTPSTTTG